VRRGDEVAPLYVRCGLFWEEVELRHLRRYLAAVAAANLRPLHVLEVPVRDVYGPHWSLSGAGVPGADTPDEAVFLPGRNVLLLGKALLWCHLHGVAELALAPLESNPFPDATPAFFAAFEAVVNQAVGGAVRVRQPYLGLHKAEVLRRGRDLPLALTFSCIRPVDGRHCGACNKCAERRRGFADVGLPDPTPYHREPPCTA
jgi:7-cyano-7-deazaguanine synthase